MKTVLTDDELDLIAHFGTCRIRPLEFCEKCQKFLKEIQA